MCTARPSASTLCRPGSVPVCLSSPVSGANRPPSPACRTWRETQVRRQVGVAARFGRSPIRGAVHADKRKTVECRTSCSRAWSNASSTTVRSSRWMDGWMDSESKKKKVKQERDIK